MRVDFRQLNYMSPVNFSGINKKKSMKQHFETRSLERTGLILDEKELVRKIQNRELEFVKRESRTRTMHRLEFLDNYYIIVYDKSRKQIVTILNDIR